MHSFITFDSRAVNILTISKHAPASSYPHEFLECNRLSVSISAGVVADKNIEFTLPSRIYFIYLHQ